MTLRRVVVGVIRKTIQDLRAIQADVALRTRLHVCLNVEGGKQRLEKRVAVPGEITILVEKR